MKILGINGSPRGSSSLTLRLVGQVLDGASSQGAETDLIDVCTLNIQFCIGCGICHETGECIHRDDYSDLATRMMESDGIVFGSPVYINAVTAQLKAVIDRMADAIH